MFSVSTASMHVLCNAIFGYAKMQIRCSIKSNIDFLNIARFNEDKFIQILASREQSGLDER